MKNNYAFGGICFAIKADFPLLDKPELEQFRVDDGAAADFTIRAVVRDGNHERTREGNTVTVPVKPENVGRIGGVQLLLHAQAAWLMLEKSAFILHASYTVTDGRALLVTAPSGTGKSTLAAHWTATVGGEVVNGDRVLVRKRDGVWTANGIYVAGTSGICHHVSAPIGAVVLLEQGERNALKPLRPYELFMRIVCQCAYDDKDPVQCAEITALVADLINENTVCCYHCLDQDEAATELEKLIWKRKS